MPLERIYNRSFHVSHHQVALTDAADRDSYPDPAAWGQDEVAHFGPRGVVITTASDRRVAVEVYAGPGQPSRPFVLAAEGMIQVGAGGLRLGNLLSDTLELLSWPQGRTAVSVYTDGRPLYEAQRIALVLDNLEGATADAAGLRGAGPSPQRIRQLIERLVQGDSASGALQRLGAPAVLPLVEALGDPARGAEARYWAAWALGGIGDARALVPLLAALLDRDDHVRRGAASALARGLHPRSSAFRDPRLLEPLIRALDDRHVQVRFAAAEALGHLGDARAVGPLLRLVERPRRWAVNAQDVWMGALALGELKAVEALPALLELLRRGDDHTRYMLAKAFRALGTPALEPLLGLLEDRDAGVRRWAAFSLGVLGRRPAFDGLVAALADPDARVRMAAAEALARLRDARAVAALVGALDDRAREVRYSAAEALTRVGDASALPALRRLLEREPPGRGVEVLHPGQAAARAIAAIEYRISVQQGASP